MNNGILLVAVALLTVGGQWLGLQWQKNSLQRQGLYYQQRQDLIYSQLADIHESLKTITDTESVYTSLSEADSLATIDIVKLQNAIAMIVRDELAKVDIDDRQMAVQNRENQPSDLERSQHAYEESAEIIDLATTNGQWQVDDTEAMIPLLNDLSERQRVELLEQFHGAFNRGEIDIISGIPPL